MRMHCLVFVALVACKKTPEEEDIGESNVEVELVPAVTIASTSYDSSSQLLVRFDGQPGVTYWVSADDGRTSVVVEAEEGPVTLTGLFSATEYDVSVTPCAESGCVGGDVDAVVTTPAEVWQVVGDAGTASFSHATRLVPDGTTNPSPMVYGPGEFEGMVQLYYNRAGLDRGNAPTRFAVADGYDSVDAADPAYGFTDADCAEDQSCTTDALAVVGTSQAIPLASGKVRFLVEAQYFVENPNNPQGADNLAHVGFIDSQDGLEGMDFHSGSETRCETEEDYDEGGGCALQLVLGNESDDPVAYAGIRDARQNKIGYPVLDAWAWDEAPGTFMVVTAHPTEEAVDDGCTDLRFSSAYALLQEDGSWELTRDDDGCLSYFAGMQAMYPMHTGDVRYKMYFNANQEPAGPPTSDPSIYLDNKPIRVMYADGIYGGESTVVEYADWESIDLARDVTYLWPDGTELDVEHESRFDDHAFFMPTGDPSVQVMYTNMSCGFEADAADCAQPPSFIGSAVLVNP